MIEIARAQERSNGSKREKTKGARFSYFATFSRLNERLLQQQMNWHRENLLALLTSSRDLT
jgi:hypothetical protein